MPCTAHTMARAPLRVLTSTRGLPAADSWGRDPSERAWRSCSERAAGGSELTRGEQPDIFAPRVGVKRPADFVRARQPSDAWARRVLAIAIVAAKLHEYSNGASGQRGYGWCSPTTGVVERVLGGVAVHSIHAASTATPVAISGTESPPLEPYGVTRLWRQRPSRRHAAGGERGAPPTRRTGQAGRQRHERRRAAPNGLVGAASTVSPRLARPRALHRRRRQRRWRPRALGRPRRRARRPPHRCATAAGRRISASAAATVLEGAPAQL